MENIDQFDVTNIHCLADEPKWQQKLDRGLRKLGLRQHLQYLVSIGKKMGGQIVHSHFGHIGWENLGAVNKLGAKHVVTFYGLDVNQLPSQFPVWRQRYLELFESADTILCEGSYMARSIIALGCPEAKVQVQHLGVDVKRIEFRPRQWLPRESLKVLIAASFREKKGIPYAIEALGILSREKPVEVTIIGDAGSDPASQREKKSILDALERCGLSKHVRLLGYQSHDALFREAHKHHLFISPSVVASDGDSEGGAPVTLIEMAASGMPIVSTTHCDIPEVIRHHETGFLAPEHDVSGLVRHLKWFVEHTDEWNGMLLAGRRHIEKEYDMRTQGKKLALLYEKLVS